MGINVTQEYCNLAFRAIKNAKTMLSYSFRFLVPAIFRLRVITGTEKPIMFGTDGNYLYADAKELIANYKYMQTTGIARKILHSTMHCIYLHQWFGRNVDRRLWNLVCDIAVEAQILSIINPSMSIPGDTEKSAIIDVLQKSLPVITAERLYYYFTSNPLSESDYEKYQQIFYMDDHPWQIYGESVSLILSVSATSERSHFDDTSDSFSSDPDSDSGMEDSSSVSDNPTENNDTDESAAWKKIAKSLMTDLETFSKSIGNENGNFVKSLHDVHRERYDYSSFLRKFATRKEVMRLSPDEFDYIQYTYGLSMYKDMPIIEPLEYREDNIINDIAIVIDTSGSTFGSIVDTFLTKTYNILCEESSFSRKFNLHLIQCDTAVQEDLVITSKEEFDEIIKDFKIKGGGGTDFRPAFSYVQDLMKNGSFTHLKGLIYLTDGYGVYPPEKPPFETAFVFVEQSTATVPAWATKLLLDKAEIDGMQQ